MEVRENDFQSTLSLTFKQTLESRYGPGISEKFRGYEKTKIKVTKEEEHISFLCQARDSRKIPVGLRLKAPVPGDRARKILEQASRSLLCSQLSYHRWRRATLNMELQQRFEEIKEYTLAEDHEPIFNKIEFTCEKLRAKLKEKHQNKLARLETKSRNNEQAKTNTRTIVNISSKTLTPEEEQILGKGLNFALSPKEPPILEIVAAVETIQLPQPAEDEFLHKIRTTLDKPGRIERNITTEEEAALNKLKKNKSIKILPADKGNATVIMDIETYDQKLKDVLEKGSYRPLLKDPTTTIEGRIYRTLKKYAEYIPDNMRTKLTPHHSKPPHLYGLPKIHKDNMPLRPITSSRNSPASELSRFLLEIIQPLQGKTESFVKNSTHFVDILKTVNLEPNDRFVSFDVESLYTNVPIEESLNIVRSKLANDTTLSERTTLPLGGVMELLECCLRNSYFQVKDRFFAQDDGLPMGSSLSPVIANLYMEWFETHALQTAKIKPKLWLRYVDDTFIVWNSGDEHLTDFLNHINNIKACIKFTMETEKDACLPFLDVLVKRREGRIDTCVYRKPTHTGQYLNNGSNHSGATKQGIIRTLCSRALDICNNQDDLKSELNHIKKDLHQNDYPDKLIDKIFKNVKDNRIRRTNSQTNQSSGFLTIPYVKGISERIRKIARGYNIQTAFRSNNTLRSFLTKTKPEESDLNKDCIYQVPCECGKSYVGETKRPLSVRIKEHEKHTRLGETTRSGIADHVWTNQHRMKWSEAKVLYKEQHWRKRKFIETAFIENNIGIFSNTSVEIANIWKPLIKTDRRIKLQG